MVELRLLAGRAALLFAAYDLNHDGQLTGAEAEAASLPLVSKALAGLDFLVDGHRVAARVAEAKLTSATPERLTAMALVELGAPSSAVRHQLQLSVARGYGDLTLLAQAMAPWSLGFSSLGTISQDHSGLLAPVRLTPGASMSIELVRAGTPMQ